MAAVSLPPLSFSIEGALLVTGVDVPKIARVLGVAPREVAEWRNGATVPERHRQPLRDYATAAVLDEIRLVGRSVVEGPRILKDEGFRDYVNQLNAAHWMVFGVSLLRFLEEQERCERGGA